MDKIEHKRLTYMHDGRKIYEWVQSLDEIEVFIEVPPGVKAKMLAVSITATQLTVGLRGNPPFIDVRTLLTLPLQLFADNSCPDNLLTVYTQEPFGETVNSSDSMWTLGVHSNNTCLHSMSLQASSVPHTSAAPPSQRTACCI